MEQYFNLKYTVEIISWIAIFGILGLYALLSIIIKVLDIIEKHRRKK